MHISLLEGQSKSQKSRVFLYLVIYSRCIIFKNMNKHQNFFHQIKPLFEQAEAKNKLLRSVAGGGVDSLNHLLARWDKFELMMESHQLMVKEQVSCLSGTGGGGGMG